MQLIVDIKPTQLRRLDRALMGHENIVDGLLSISEEARVITYHLVANFLVMRLQAQENQSVLNPNLYMEEFIELHSDNQFIDYCLSEQREDNRYVVEILTRVMSNYYPECEVVKDRAFGYFPLWIKQGEKTPIHIPQQHKDVDQRTGPGDKR